MKQTVSYILVFLVFLPTMAVAQSVNVPLEHWVYDFLDRFQTRGLIQDFRFASRPYSRREVARMLAEAEERIQVDGRILSSAERSLYEQLKGEFHEELADQNVSIQSRYRERHLATWVEDNNRVDVDLLFDQRLDVKTGDAYATTETIARTTLGGIVRGQLKDNL